MPLFPPSTMLPGAADGFRKWLNDPTNRAALLYAGTAMLQPMRLGESPLMRLGSSVGGGYAAALTAAEKTRLSEMEQMSETEKENYRRSRDAQDDTYRAETLGLSKKNLALDSANTQSLIAERSDRKIGLTQLLKEQNSTRGKASAAYRKAFDEAATTASEASMLSPGQEPRTPDAFKADPVWVEQFQRDFLTSYKASEAAADALYPSDMVAPPAAPTAATALQVGDVIKGYRFLGGDPAKEENWAPVKGDKQ